MLNKTTSPRTLLTQSSATPMFHLFHWNFNIPRFLNFSASLAKTQLLSLAFIKRVDKWMRTNNWMDTVAYHAQKTWTTFKPLFKCEFAMQTDNKLNVDGLTNYAMRPSEQWQNYMGRLGQIMDVLDKSYDASSGLKRTSPSITTQWLPTSNKCAQTTKISWHSNFSGLDSHSTMMYKTGIWKLQTVTDEIVTMKESLLPALSSKVIKVQYNNFYA